MFQFLNLTMWGSQVDLGRNGILLPEGRVPDLEAPYSVRVDTNGSLITVFINGEQALQSNVPGFENGFIALACTSTGALIDNFVVTPLDSLE